MNVTVNGEATPVDPATTVAGLLHARGTDRPGIAVAVNGEVVPSTLHAATELREGDTVEIVTAVQGG